MKQQNFDFLCTSKKILVVEDNAIIALDIQIKLKSYNCDVLIAHNKTDCMRALKKLSDSICLIIMDISLGKDNGIDVVKEIKTQYEIPFIYMTGQGDIKTLCNAFDTNPFGYIIKPYSNCQFHMIIENALRRYSIEKKSKNQSVMEKVIFNTIKDGIAVIDEKTRKIVFVNNGFIDLLGYDQEILEKKHDEIHSKEYMNIINDVIKNKGHKISGIPCINNHNDVLYVDIKFSYIKMEKKKYIICVYTDVSIRLLHEDKITQTIDIIKVLIDKEVSPTSKTNLHIIKEKVQDLIVSTKKLRN